MVLLLCCMLSCAWSPDLSGQPLTHFALLVASSHQCCEQEQLGPGSQGGPQRPRGPEKVCIWRQCMCVHTSMLQLPVLHQHLFPAWTLTRLRPPSPDPFSGTSRRTLLSWKRSGSCLPSGEFMGRVGSVHLATHLSAWHARIAPAELAPMLHAHDAPGPHPTPS